MPRRQDDLYIPDENPRDFIPITLEPTPSELRKFFEQYAGLSTGELGVLANRSNTTIRRWKRKLRLSMRSNPFKKDHNKAKRTEVEIVTDPAIWDNKPWFEDQYNNKRKGLLLIARTIKKPVELVIKRLRRYEIKTRSVQEAHHSKNPCCNEAWLHFYYATRPEYWQWCADNKIDPKPDGGQGLGLVKCGELAGVVPYTIFNWLTKFGMHIRDNYEASALASRRLYSSDARPILGKAEG